MTERTEILLAEDDETDVMLLQRAFRDAGVNHPLQVAHDGQAAQEFLAARQHGEHDRLPSLVLLDLKMPRRTGIDVLEWIRGNPALRCLPVFIFSSSSRRDDVERAYASGANGFIVKPPSMAERAEIARFIDTWLRLNQPSLVVTEGARAAQAFAATRLRPPE
jgi:CheY-like chemotaxis protein